MLEFTHARVHAHTHTHTFTHTDTFTRTHTPHIHAHKCTRTHTHIHSGPREDATRIGSAGVVRRQAVDISPLRRVNQVRPDS